jgi:hypothetical protein
VRLENLAPYGSCSWNLHEIACIPSVVSGFSEAAAKYDTLVGYNRLFGPVSWGILLRMTGRWLVLFARFDCWEISLTAITWGSWTELFFVSTA